MANNSVVVVFSVVAAVLMVMSSMICVINADDHDHQVHHVVGDDRGWEPSSNISSWAAGKIFSVGDNVWFAYSAALESVVELNSHEDYESCDVSNPIRMYTDGLDRVYLDKEGSRYFSSSDPNNCKKGLKLHVHVNPKGTSSGSVLYSSSPAPEPSAPSSATSTTLPILALAAAGTILGLLFI